MNAQDAEEVEIFCHKRIVKMFSWAVCAIALLALACLVIVLLEMVGLIQPEINLSPPVPLRSAWDCIIYRSCY